MIKTDIRLDRAAMERQYTDIKWDESSGLPPAEMKELAEKTVRDMAGREHIEIKAALFAALLRNAQTAVDPFDPFADHIRHGRLLRGLTSDVWTREIYGKYSPLRTRERNAWNRGAYRAEMDFDHITPDWGDIVRLGVPGLISRLREKRGDAPNAFYDSALNVYEAVVCCLRRLARGAEKRAQNGENPGRMTALSRCLTNLTLGAPSTLYEGLQLSYIFHELLDLEVWSVCTLGGFDRLFGGLYDADLASGRYTREEEKELIKYYLVKYDAKYKAPNESCTTSYLGKSFFIGGLDSDGRDVTNGLTYAVLEAYDEVGVIAPKLSIRVSSRSPDELLRRVSRSVRDDNRHYVLVNDDVAVEALARVGCDRRDAREYAPIGCYEPAVVGREVGCTGGTSLNIVKGIELALNRGVDPLSGETLGIDTGDLGSFDTFERFYSAVTAQLAELFRQIKETLDAYEPHYEYCNPAPLLSGAMPDCVGSGVDAYASGARYNNSATNCGCIGSAADSLAAIKEYVYEKRELTLAGLRDILAANWEGNELLRVKLSAAKDRWGNGSPETDALAARLAADVSAIITGAPNSRGGVYKAGLYSIDRAYKFGAVTGATPDGRRSGEALSKNLCPAIGRDRNGVTAVIDSTARLDLGGFPNGSVLDLLLHPSAVSGEAGLEAMIGLTKSYMRGGGFGLQFNIFDTETLLDAQAHPEKYSQLQIRLCGWNAYFVALTRQQQDCFIAENKHTN